jgi:hypothetical protein
MKTIRTALSLLLAVLWLPVTSHCLLLESFSELEFLACCEHQDAPAPTHHEDECATDACATLENAQYQSCGHRVTVPPLNPQVAFLYPARPVVARPAAALAFRQVDRHLPYLPGPWQFIVRAAPVPRAPSIVS